MLTAQSSKVLFTAQMPTANDLGDQILLIVDQKVLRQPLVRKLAKSVDAVYPVAAGEKLKEAGSFPQHIQKILKLTENLGRSRLTVVTLGGGSVGDFGGFVASVLRRGVRLVHIPSTWLAAMDSAHGGKTALNVKGLKNCIGTFYPAEKIYVVAPILKQQPSLRSREAAGELSKVALLDGSPWTRRLKKDRAPLQKKIWKYLKDAVNAKYQVIQQDPYETQGIRQLLNLGHTFGHVIEASRGIPHGTAVGQGLYFAMKWSLQRDYLSPESYFEIADFLSEQMDMRCWVDGDQPQWKPITLKTAKKFLLQDKKRTSKEKVQFVFLSGWGKPKLVAVPFADILKEATRQGWVRG